VFITAVKTAVVEALDDAFSALGQQTSNTTTDLVPNSVTIDYPLEQVQWPAILVQFRPSVVQWTGLNPDQYTAVSGTVNYTSSRMVYFEGVLDFQILAMHSEERDRLWDSLYNLFLMNPGSPGSQAFYNSLYQNDLVGLTLNQGAVINLGDTISPGTPWSQEELSYEASVRVKCVGQCYEVKYDITYPSITDITVSGTQVVQFYT